MQLDRHHIWLYIVIIGAFFGLSWFYAEHRGHVAELNAAVAEQKAKAAEEQNQKFQSQVALQVQTLVQANNTLQAQIGTLQQAVIARNQALVTRQEAIKALPPTELAARHGLLVGLPPPEVSSSGFLSPTGLEIATVTLLEAVPVLKADKIDLEAQIGSLKGVVSNDVKVLDLEKQARAGDSTVCKATVEAKNVEIVSLKASARRSKFRWFLAGGIVGEIVRIFLTRSI